LLGNIDISSTPLVVGCCLFYTDALYGYGYHRSFQPLYIRRFNLSAENRLKISISVVRGPSYGSLGLVLKTESRNPHTVRLFQDFKKTNADKNCPPRFTSRDNHIHLTVDGVTYVSNGSLPLNMRDTANDLHQHGWRLQQGPAEELYLTYPSVFFVTNTENSSGGRNIHPDQILRTDTCSLIFTLEEALITR